MPSEAAIDPPVSAARIANRSAGFSEYLSTMVIALPVSVPVGKRGGKERRSREEP
jgi:hypothetical protein